MQVPTCCGKNRLSLAPLAAAGFAAIAVQTALLREIIVVCQGNELTVGFALAAWLAAGAAGSRAAAAFRSRSADGGFPQAVLALALAGIPALLAVRGYKPFTGHLPGQAVSLGHAALLSAIAMAPAGAAAGAAFAYGVRWLESRQAARATGTAYWAEAVGFTAGGAAFAVGAPLLPVLGTMAAASLAAAATALAITTQRVLRTAAATATLLLAGVIAAGPALERATVRWLYPGSEVSSTTESSYGRTVVAAAGGQVTVYHNGWPVASRPAAPTLEQEEMVALGLLAAGQQRRVLLIGGAELLPLLREQDVGSVTYAEIDPVLVRAIGAATTGKAALVTAQVDGRRFLETTAERFDVIFVGTPYAANLSTNRYYTEEFMTAARSRLAAGGVLVYGLSGAETARDRYKDALGGSIEATVARAFEHHAVFRGNRDILIGRYRSPVPAADAIVDRSAAAGLRLPTLTRESLRQRLAIGQALATDRGTAVANRDRRPAALASGLLLWQSSMSPGTVRIYQRASSIHPLWWLLLTAAIPWRRRRTEGTAFSAGAAAMGLQMLCLWGLQISQGELYLWLALANALFMAGTAIGAAVATRGGPAANRAIVTVDAAFCAWAGAFLLANASLPLTGWCYLFGSAVTGVLLGVEFSLLAAVTGQVESRSAGPLYAADMLGGALAALWIGTLAIPVWGFLAAAGAVAGIKLISLPWWALRVSNHAHR